MGKSCEEEREVDRVVGPRGETREMIELEWTAVLAVNTILCFKPTVIHKSKSKVAREQPGKTREERREMEVLHYINRRVIV